MKLTNKHKIVAASAAFAAAAVAGSAVYFTSGPSPEERLIEIPSMQNLKTQFELVSPPQCTSANGRKVTFMGVNREVLAQRNIMLGVALETFDEKPLVLYDREMLRRLPGVHQAHVLMHECMHHANGDIQTPDRTPLESQAKEDRADCDAFKRLAKEEKFDKADLDTIAEYTRRIYEAYMVPKEEADTRNAKLYRCAGFTP